MNADQLAWLRWVLIPNLGLKRSHQLLNLIDSPQALFLTPERWPLPDSIRQTLREMNLLGEQHPVHRRALEQLAWQDAHPDHHLIFPDDRWYPGKLNELEDAPLVLWLHGQPECLNQPQIGMVGSRHASANALRHGRRISRDLASAGLVITSGGARGIDTACHQATVDQDGTTVAVLGCGVDICYPKGNAALFRRITERGALLSEYPLGTSPRPGHFPRRNRLISALSEALVVVEASLKSGSLITAQHALDQGTDIFAMPGDIGNPNSEGCHQLIRDGASLLADAQDLLNHLNWRTSCTSQPAALHPLDLTPLQHQVLDVLRCEQQPLDALAFQLSMSMHQLLEPLLELELKGIIVQQPGGYTLSDIA